MGCCCSSGGGEDGSGTGTSVGTHAELRSAHDPGTPDVAPHVGVPRHQKSYSHVGVTSGGTPLLGGEKKGYDTNIRTHSSFTDSPGPQRDGDGTWDKLKAGFREFNQSMKGWGLGNRKCSVNSVGDADNSNQDFYSCMGSETTASRPPSRLGGAGSFSGDGLPVPRKIKIEPVVPANRKSGQGPIWASHNKEVVRVFVDDLPPRNYEFMYNGVDFDLRVNGYFIPGMKSFSTLKDMATDSEAAPHAEWKVSHEDKKAGITAWTRPPPPTPWLAPPETMAQATKMHQVRVKAEFDCPAQLLYDMLHDSTYRQQWDDKMLKGERIAELTSRADIGYYAAHFPAPLSNRDFCNLRTWREFQTGEYIIMNYSVMHEDCVEDKYVRAVSYGSGYYLQALSKDRCAFYSVSHTDMKASVPAWILNGKVGQISCGIIPKLREAASKYELWKGLSNPKANGAPAWRSAAVQWTGVQDAVAALLTAQETAYSTLLDAEAADRELLCKQLAGTPMPVASPAEVMLTHDTQHGNGSLSFRPDGREGSLCSPCSPCSPCTPQTGMATQPQSLAEPAGILS